VRRVVDSSIRCFTPSLLFSACLFSFTAYVQTTNTTRSGITLLASQPSASYDRYRPSPAHLRRFPSNSQANLLGTLSGLGTCFVLPHRRNPFTGEYHAGMARLPPTKPTIHHSSSLTEGSTEGHHHRREKTAQGHALPKQLVRTKGARAI
jgi:hypothetical protein